MAATTITNNTYAGKRYAEYFTPAFLPPTGLAANNLVTLIDNVKDKAVMLDYTKELEFQTRTTGFTPQAGAGVRDEKVITLAAYGVYDTMDYPTVFRSWEAETLGAGSMNDYDPRELQAFAVEKVYVPALARLNETLYILGKAGAPNFTFSGDYAGILGKLEAGTDVSKYSLDQVDSAVRTISSLTSVANAVLTLNSTTGIKAGDVLTITSLNGSQQIGGVTIVGQDVTVKSVTSSTVVVLNETVTGSPDGSPAGEVQFVNESNILDILNFAYNVMPEVTRKDPNARMLISSKMEKAYRVVNGSVATGSGTLYRENFFTNPLAIPFNDIMMVSMNFWKQNTLAFWSPSNVFLAVDLLSDEVNAQIEWMGHIAERNYRFRNDMKSGIDYLYGDKITYIRPA
jgi:hypothetical protein